MNKICFILFVLFSIQSVVSAEKVTTISSIKYTKYEKNVDANGKYVIEKEDGVLKAGKDLYNSTEKPIKIWLKKRSSKDKQGWIHLEPNSKLKLNTTNNQRKEKIIFDLEMGSIKVNHTWKLKKDEIFTVRTPTVVAGVRGTQYELSFIDGQSTNKTIESTVYVKKDGDGNPETNVAAGNMISANDQIGQVQEIPEAEFKELTAYFSREAIIDLIKEDNPNFYENEQFDLELDNEGKIKTMKINGWKRDVISKDYTLLVDFDFIEALPEIKELIIENAKGLKNFDFLKSLKGTTNLEINMSIIADKDLAILPKDLPLEILKLYENNNIKSLQYITSFKNLKTLAFPRCENITDISLVKDLKLEKIAFTPKLIKKGVEVLKEMDSLETINDGIKDYTPAEFWTAFDRGDFK